MDYVSNRRNMDYMDYGRYTQAETLLPSPSVAGWAPVKPWTLPLKHAFTQGKGTPLRGNH
jgi:hypothetical protein